ncbi:MAG: hypothetical protein ACR2QK_00720 [Acidimicrobiales bacterium]
MSTDAEFYIAWDGKRYQGGPPSDWYLAADNRWWPPQQAIETDSEDGRSAAHQSPPPSPSAVPADGSPPPPLGRDQRQQPTVGSNPDWAPRTGEFDPGPSEPPSPSEAPATPTQHGAPPPYRTSSRTTGAGQSPRRPRKRGFRPGFLIPVAIFVFFRFGVAAFDSGPVEPDNPLTTVDFGQEGLPSPTTPVPTIAPTAPGSEDLLSVDTEHLEITTLSCGLSEVTIEVRNRGTEPARFLVDLVLEPTGSGAPGPPVELSDIEIEELQPGQSAALCFDRPSELDPFAPCAVVSASSSRP